MDKLILPASGGYYLNSEDLEFELSAHREAISQLIKPVAKLNNGFMILSGCETTRIGLTETVASGFVVLNYEICAFAGGQFNYQDGDFFSLQLDESFDPIGLKNLANGTSYNGLQRRRAKIVADGNGLLLANQFRFANMLLHLLDNVEAFKTHFIVPINGWSQNQTDTLNAQKKGNKVFVNGILKAGNLYEEELIIFTLPTEFAPLTHVYQVCPMIGGGAVVLHIAPNGEGYVKNLFGNVSINQSSLLTVNNLNYDI